MMICGNKSYDEKSLLKACNADICVTYIFMKSKHHSLEKFIHHTINEIESATLENPLLVDVDDHNVHIWGNKVILTTTEYRGESGIWTVKFMISTKCQLIKPFENTFINKLRRLCNLDNLVNLH